MKVKIHFWFFQTLLVSTKFRLVIQAILGKWKVRREIQILFIRFVILKVRNLLLRYNLKGPLYVIARSPESRDLWIWLMNMGFNNHFILFLGSRFCTNFVGKCHSALLTGARSSPAPNCTEGTWLTRNKQQQDLNQFFRRPTRKYPMNFSDPRKRQGRTFLILFFFSPYISGLLGIDFFHFIFSQVM